MLSAAKLTTANGSIHNYYSADDYYSQSSVFESKSESFDKGAVEPNKSPSFWHGKLAKDFNLKGPVDGKILDDLTNGILPDGTQMQGRVDKDGNRVNDPGRDLTFSAPKSFSILSEVLGIKELKEIDKKSVKETLDHIEENYSYSRNKVNNKVTKQITKNMLFATYTHDTSRNLDPNRHTHCIALNVTKKEDGTYKTVHFDPIFDDYKHLGLVYRSNLAYNLQKAGFNIEITNQQNGFFEIKDFPKEIIDKFSSRRKEIETQARELGINSAKVKQISAFLTRNKKINIANHILKEDWNNTLKQELAKLDKSIDVENIDAKNLDKIFRNSLQKNWNKSIANNNKENLLKLFGLKQNNKNKPDQKTKINPSSSARTSLKVAIKQLSERNSIFTQKDLVDAALKDSLGKTTIDHINKEIINFKNNKSLISAAKVNYRDHFASKASLRTELKIIEFAEKSLKRENFKSPIYTTERLEYFTASNPDNKYHNLNSGQKQAVDLLLTSSNTIDAIQGYAGTGKTTMLETTNELAKVEGKSLIGLAPSAIALKELQSKNIQSRTLQSFLEQYNGYAEGRGTPKGLLQVQEEYKDKSLIVDEASMISSMQMRNLLTIAERFNLKITLIGDVKQLNAVEAGNPFYQMQKHGLKTVLMSDIVRQENTRLKSAVYDVINASKTENINKGYIKRAFSKIDDLIEVKLDKKDEKENEKQDEDKKYTRISNKDNLTKIRDKVALTNKIAKETADNYCSLTSAKRNNTILLTLSNQSRIKVNNEVRRNLKNSGELRANNSVKKEVLINKNLEDELKRNINSYQEGNILRFNRSITSTKSDKINIVKGKYYQVSSKDIDNNHIYLTELKENKEESVTNKIKSLFINTNKTVTFDPAKMGSRKSSVEIYNKEQKEFLAGERINFTKSFVNRGINNSMSGIVKDIHDNSLTIKTENDKELIIKNNDNIIKHIDYGYAFTVNRAQGTTYDNVIAVLESHHPKLTSQKPFYVEISRARKNVTLIMDDKRKIIERLEKETGEKVSIIESIKHKEDIAKLALRKSEEKTGGKQQKQISNQRTNKTATTNDKPNIRKTAKSYKSYQYPDELVKKHFKEEIITRLSHEKTDFTNLDLALDRAFANKGQRQYFGAKKKGELKWNHPGGYAKQYNVSNSYFDWNIGQIPKNELERLEFKEATKEEIIKQKQEQQLRADKLKIELKTAEEKLSQKATFKYNNHYPESNRIKGKNNQYLSEKGIEEFYQNKDIKFRSDNAIVVPVKDIDGKICTLQIITENGDKRFLKALMDGAGGKKGRLFFFHENNLINNKTNVILAEGLATAASIDKAINTEKSQNQKIPIAVCFDVGNFEHCLKNIKSKYPNHSYIIAADDDRLKGNKTSHELAIKVAEKYGAKLISPKFNHDNPAHREKLSSDFNDLHTIEGINEVGKQFYNKNNYKYFEKKIERNQANNTTQKQTHKYFEVQK